MAKFRRPQKPVASPPPAPTAIEPRKPRDLDAVVVPPAPTRALARAEVATAELRHTAAMDYITDPEGRSVRWHWERDDRTYKKRTTWGTFERWSNEDRWGMRRETFWRDVEARVLHGWRDEIVAQRIREIAEMHVVRSALAEWLAPLRGKNGEVKRDKNGMPIFAMALPPYDRLAKTFLDLDSQLMLKRGEATARTESTGPVGGAKAAQDPVTATPPLSPETVRVLARTLLRLRQPELAESEGPIVDVSDPVRHDGGGKK